MQVIKFKSIYFKLFKINLILFAVSFILNTGIFYNTNDFIKGTIYLNSIFGVIISDFTPFDITDYVETLLIRYGIISNYDYYDYLKIIKDYDINLNTHNFNGNFRCYRRQLFGFFIHLIIMLSILLIFRKGTKVSTKVPYCKKSLFVIIVI